MPTHEDWIRFFKILFILLLISVATQILAIFLSRSPAVLLGIDFQPVMDHGQVEYSNLAEDPSKLRPISSSYISLLALMGAMFYILYRKDWKLFLNWKWLLFLILFYSSGSPLLF